MEASDTVLVFVGSALALAIMTSAEAPAGRYHPSHMWTRSWVYVPRNRSHVRSRVHQAHGGPANAGCLYGFSRCVYMQATLPGRAPCHGAVARGFRSHHASSTTCFSPSPSSTVTSPLAASHACSTAAPATRTSAGRADAHSQKRNRHNAHRESRGANADLARSDRQQGPTQIRAAY